MKLGKKPATYDKRDLCFASYRTHAPIALPPLPRTFGHQALIKSWPMLANDEHGCCVWSGAAFEHMVWSAEADRLVQFDDRGVLADYGAVTGFSPDIQYSDNGTVVRDAMVYRRRTGVIDSKGHRHKIGAFVSIEPGHTKHIEDAVYLFGAVGIGLDLPESALDQSQHNKPWSVVPGSGSAGGHYVALLGRRGDTLYCVSWGKLQPLSVHFLERYCDEAWGMLAPEMLGDDGVSPEGFDLTHLRHDLEALAA